MFDVKQIEGKSCPLLRCDVCGKPITDYRDGIAVFDEEWGVGFVHKPTRKQKCDPGSGGWFDLDVFFYFLCKNAGIDMERAERKARKLKMP
jgi:hypothetical protein